MKRGTIFLAMLFLFFGFSSHISNAQEETGEKKIVKRVKIVTIDENGERTVIDTTVTGDTDLETLDLGEGMKWVHKDIHKDMTHFEHHGEEIEEGQSHIIIRSKGEVTDLVIDGDAVITIKDGKVNVEGEKVTIDTTVMKKGEGKVVKEKKQR
ncbi:MAG: hypothetical protein K8R35_07340 [Bacteroidales bacterium]|nr:hypothetical protein [Bacteroidales bacterium]